MATVQVSMTMKELLAWQVRLGKNFMPAARRGLVSGANRCLPLLVRSVDDAPPASPGGKQGANNTGAYRRGWSAEATNDGARVWNKVKYAGVIEHGRRKGARQPPQKPIAHWLQRRAGLSEEEAKRMAFVVARSIKRRGLQPRHVMMRVQGDMLRVVNEELKLELRMALGGKR
jgi:hypothetical protein